jgi:hypothetical protein
MVGTLMAHRKRSNQTVGSNKLQLNRLRTQTKPNNGRTLSASKPCEALPVTGSDSWVPVRAIAFDIHASDAV